LVKYWVSQEVPVPVVVVACRQAGRQACGGGRGEGCELAAAGAVGPACLLLSALPTLTPRSVVPVCPSTHPHGHLCGLGAGLSAIHALAQWAARGNRRCNALQTSRQARQQAL
jgi:hypothetical protein